MGEQKTNDYTTEQLLDETLKNIDGESNLEVRERMNAFFEEILEKYSGNNIAVISHGASIKYYLQNFCKYDFETNSFVFENKKIFSAKLESPCVLKLSFDGKKLKVLKNISYV